MDAIIARTSANGSGFAIEPRLSGAPATRPTKDRFTEALDALISGCMDAGMHSVEFIGPLKAALREMRSMSMPSKSDEAHNRAGGLAPMTTDDIRKALELDAFEPNPMKV